MKPAIEIQQEATLTPDQVQEALKQYLQRTGLEVVGGVDITIGHETPPPCDGSMAMQEGRLVCTGAKAQVLPRKRQRKAKS